MTGRYQSSTRRRGTVRMGSGILTSTALRLATGLRRLGHGAGMETITLATGRRVTTVARVTTREVPGELGKTESGRPGRDPLLHSLRASRRAMATSTISTGSPGLWGIMGCGFGRQAWIRPSRLLAAMARVCACSVTSPTLREPMASGARWRMIRRTLA